LLLALEVIHKFLSEVAIRNGKFRDKGNMGLKTKNEYEQQKKKLATQISSNITGMLVCGLTRVVCIVVGYLTTISV
jgi:hypothetical protein